MNTFHHQPRRRLERSEGFILVTTLWILAALTLAVGAYSVWTRMAIHRAQELMLEHKAGIHEYSTLATIQYNLGVSRFTIAGLPPVPVGSSSLASAPLHAGDMGAISVFPRGHEIRLDGTVYRAANGIRFSIQDMAGLLNADEGANSNLRRLLGLLSVPLLQQGPLLAKLLDYTDPDDLVHLNGAEAPQYRARGLPPPPNRRLLTNMEAYRVLDWSGQTGLWGLGGWQRYTTALHFGLLNLNTAPQSVLESLPGVTSEIAERIIAARNKAPFVNAMQAITAAGGLLTLNPFDYITYPSRNLRIELWVPGTEYVHCYNLKLTSALPDHPWKVESFYRIPLQEAPRFADQASRPAPGVLYTAPARPDN